MKPTPIDEPLFEQVGLPPFSTTLGIDNQYNPVNGVTLPTYSRPTLVLATISGLHTATYIPLNQVSTLDARGRFTGGIYNACYEGVSVRFGGGEILFGDCVANPSPVSPLTKYQVVQGAGSAYWTGARPHASDECDYSPCRRYEGDKFISIEPVQVDFTATASPTSLAFRDTVTVTLTVTPSQVGGITVPFSIDSTKWIPGFGTQTNPCQFTDFAIVDPQTRRCKKSFTRSGTYSLWATVNGTQQSKTWTITVTPPTLDVDAAPATTTGPDSVTFTATVTPSNITWNLSMWLWTPDVGSGGLNQTCSWSEKTCKRLVSRSGWMKGTATIGEYALADSIHVTVNPPALHVTAAPANITSGQSVTFTATLTPEPPTAWNLSTWTWRPESGTGGISAPCNWWEKTCARTCTKSGWMKASTTIGAFTLSDSAYVSVVPCLTGDPLLDDRRIRRALLDALNGASPNGPAANRRERGGMRFRRPDGSIADTLFAIGPTDTPCSFDFAARSLAGVGVPIAAWHSHPFTPLDPNDPLPSNCPRVANSKPLPPGKVFVAAAGPSVPQDTQSGMDHIVVEKNGPVYRVDPNGSITPYPRNGQCDPLSL